MAEQQEPKEPKHSPSLAERFPALARLGSGLRKRRIRFVAQVTAVDCAAACLAMVLGYWGRQMRLEEVQRAAGLLNLHGVNARALLEAGRRFGLTGRAAQVEIDSLGALPIGSILHWEFRHFVVFEGLTRQGVQVVDPAYGRRYLSMEQFRKSFTGIALLFEPSETFETGTAVRGPSRYLRSLLEARPILLRVLVMSLLLQFFALALPSLTGALVDFVIPTGDLSMLTLLSVGMGVLLVFQFLSTMVRSHLLLHLRTHLDARLTVGFLDHLVHLPFAFFLLRSSGDLIARLNSNATVRELLTSGALSALLDGMLATTYLFLLLAMNWKLGLLAVGLALAQVLVFILSRERQRELMSRDLEVSAAARGYEVEMMTGMQTIKCLGVETRSVQHWSNLYVDVLNVSLERGRVDALVESLTGVLRLGSPLILLIVGTHQVMQEQLRLGEMLALNALAVGFLVPIANLVTNAFRVQLVGTYLERVDDVLETPLEQQSGTARRSIELRGGIQLDNVSFRYGPLSPMVVQDISVKIQPGQFVAIVGRSGAGKSTLAHLLLGLYQPTAGSIFFDDAPLAELDVYELRQQLGVVLQNPILFRGDIRRNIAYVDPSLPLQSVMAAAKFAQVHDDIMAMPMQYDTLLSESGSSVSGGQRQRIALARALACDPAILLLDEATNALDVKTERAVQEALAQLQCTRVVIAHRLTTVERADVILVMEKGRLVEQGSHAELIARRGFYYELVAAQQVGDLAA
ncbi:peptidase domain-containing ABC transporter [Archangium violaceum]|uniref:Lantibiotic ABC transporter permease n=1 Tax=Archangium violaceum Cb vi76 TaxID=1406225 RepID=A0A084T1J0_9BACT|nr:peptidase domain-containing ABC transporter [Archangium violaceum]KFA94575.1 lantibiotic ABC transporter permease [Archangium violaceum Cb vi76]